MQFSTKMYYSRSNFAITVQTYIAALQLEMSKKEEKKKTKNITIHILYS